MDDNQSGSENQTQRKECGECSRNNEGLICTKIYLQRYP